MKGIIGYILLRKFSKFWVGLQKCLEFMCWQQSDFSFYILLRNAAPLPMPCRSKEAIVSISFVAKWVPLV